MATDPVTLLVVDDDPTAFELIHALLEQEPAQVLHAETADEALATIAGGSVDVVIVDYILPGMDGIALLEKIRQRAPQVSRVLLTAHPGVDVLTGAVNRGAVDKALYKKLSSDEILVALRELIVRRLAERPG